MDSLAILRTSILASLGLASACSRNEKPKPDPAATPVSAAPEMPIEKPYVEPPKKKSGPSPEYASKLGLSLGEDGHLRRSAKVQCTSTPGSCPVGALGDCKVDKDCKERAHGYCRKMELGSTAPAQCACSYECASDADCQKDEACLCNDPSWDGHAACVPAKCRSDADCKSGKCELAEWYNGCGTVRMFACRTASDKCQTSADCPTGGRGGGCGVSDATSIWECMTPSCVVGRPLVVDGESIAAKTTARDDWASGQPKGESMRWAEIARLEHASIASFAIFTLELLQLGAPSDLLRDTQLAALDEIEHARLAFGRASAIEPMGPAKLDLSMIRVRTDPSEIARALVFEGCIGETIGSAEAAREPDDEVFSQIARDEQRHAELAWRALQWMLETHPEIEPAVRDVFASVRASDPFRAVVLDEVIKPCAAALLA